MINAFEGKKIVGDIIRTNLFQQIYAGISFEGNDLCLAFTMF